MLPRLATAALEQIYQAACSLDSDIHEHLPRLRELAAGCDHVTEFGLRWASGSTVAFLAAQPRVLISWDVNPYAVVNQQVLNLITHSGKTRFEPRVGDSKEINIEQTDLLFIDTVHTFSQMKAELERHAMVHACKVKRFLAFHDIETFGLCGEDGSRPGILGAISWFHKNNFPLWRPIHVTRENNGLLVLQRESDWEKTQR